MTSQHMYQFQVGGSLRANAPSYIARQADQKLYNALRDGEFCYIFNSRQMGKSSLKVRIKNQLQQEGHQCAAVDLTSIGSEAITPQQWYKGFIFELSRSLALSPVHSLRLWWEKQDGFSLIQHLQHYLEDVVLAQTSPEIKIFILVDEIDSILSLPFKTDDFFAFIRFCYNQRSLNPDYNRLTFALFGVATPSDLIQDIRRTPFNIGRAIALSGFTFEEALPLAKGLKEIVGNSNEVLKAVLGWTAGQPFLTQKLCQIVVDYCLQEGEHCLSFFSGREEQGVERLVQMFILRNWESQDEPEHFRTICDRLLSHPEKSSRLLGLYQQILLGEEVKSDDTREQTDLLLSGLVVKQDSKLQVKCRLYQEVFNLSWVEGRMATLRPYAEALNIWLISPWDESRLLRGQALVDAKAWAEGKSLADQEYRFLSASEALQQRAVQQALEVARSKAVADRLAEQERSNRQQRRLITALGGLLVVAIGLGVLTFGESQKVKKSNHRIKLSKIDATANAANEVFLSEGHLDALVAAIDARQQLQTLDYPPPIDLSEKVDDVLRQAVFKAVERNRFHFGEEVRGVSFSPDDQVIASAGLAGTIKLWRRDGQLLNQFVEEPNRDGVFDVQFSPDGEVIATANGTGTARLWSRQGRLLQTLVAHQGSVFNVEFSPDGRWIVTTGADQTVRLWNRQGQLLKTLVGHTHEVWKAAFSPDGQLLATGSRDRTVRLWSFPQGTLLNTFKGYDGPVRAIAFSPNSQILATGSDDATVRIWNRSGEGLHTYRAHDGAIQDLTFLKNGQSFATASWDGEIKIWSVDGALQKKLQGHNDRVWTMDLSSDGSTLVSGSWDQSIRLWQLDKTPLTSLQGHTATILGINYSPDGAILASASDDQTVKLWTSDGTLLHTLKGHVGEVYGVAFSPDGQQLASSGLDRTIRLWDLQGTPLKVLKGHQAEIWRIAFSPDGQWLASASFDGTVRIWRTEDGSLVKILARDQGRVFDVKFSPDGQTLATASSNRMASLWALDGTLLASMRHRGVVFSVAFSPDGKKLATGSFDQTIKLWKADGTLLKILTGHQGEVSDVAFSADGQFLASGSFDGTIKLWRLDGTLIESFRGHQKRVWTTIFNPKKQEFASAGEDKTVILWDLDQVLSSDKIFDHACNWVSNYLSTNRSVLEKDRTLCD